MLTNMSRASLYLLLTALEQDLREIAEQHLGAMKAVNIFDEVALAKLQERIKKNTDGESPSFTLSQCLRYSDLGDCIHVINRHSTKLPEGLQKPVRSAISRIEKAIPVRNRVMHSRPLEWDDFPSVTDLAQSLVSTQTDLWSKLREILKLLKHDPELALRTQIPFTDPSKVLHNLPTPDFDDTGFVGRNEILVELRSALRGAYPVISLTGEGGVGKSALALKACYELVDEASRFEGVVWTSAKSNRLSFNEIQAINNSITSSLGVFESALSQLGSSSSIDPLKDLVQHLTDFPILLIIDNLETVLDENMRTLARLMPASGSKLIFTTRIGLGALDFPIAVPRLRDKESQHFLRRVAQIWRVNSLNQLNDEKLREYTEKLQRNPLFIKWFVQAIRTGNAPERVLANPKIILEFCLQNVFEKLNKDRMKIIEAIASTRPPHTLALLSYYTDLTFATLEENIASLLGANIVSQRLEKDGTSSFALSDLARLYVRSYHRPSPSIQRGYEAQERRLTALAEGYSSSSQGDIFEENSLTIRGRTDIPAAQILKEALANSRRGDYPNALILAERAKNMAPDYFEVFRVSALLHAWLHDFIAAEDMYERAVSLSPEHAPLYYFYGQFVLRQRNEAEQARSIFLEGLKREPKSVALKRSLAQAELFLGRYDEVRKILDEIADTIEILPERQRRILVAVYLQSYAREMGRESEGGNYERALAALRGLRKVWETQNRWIDEVAREKVMRQATRLETMTASLKPSPAGKEAAELAEWFHVTVRKPLTAHVEQKEIPYLLDERNETRIVGSVESKIENYGFLNVDGRIEKLFFHKGSFVNAADFDRIEPRDEVSFRVGENYKGAIATEATIHRLRSLG